MVNWIDVRDDQSSYTHLKIRDGVAGFKRGVRIWDCRLEGVECGVARGDCLRRIEAR